MGTTDVLRSSIQHTQSRLSERLAEARSMEASRDRPRDGHERIDAFLATTSTVSYTHLTLPTNREV